MRLGLEFILLTKRYPAVEPVRVGESNDAFRALNFQFLEAGRGVKAKDRRGHRSGRKLQQRRDLRVDGNVENLLGARAASDRSLSLGSTAETRNGFYRAKHLH